MARNPARTTKTLLEGFFDLYPSEAAWQLETVLPGEAAQLLQGLSAQRALPVMERISPGFGSEVLEAMGAGAAPLLERLDPMRAAALLARAATPARELCLAALPESTAREVRALMSYPPNTAGALMDPHALTFRREALVKDALARLRTLGKRRVQSILLVDDAGTPVRSVALQDLATAAPQEALEHLPAEPLVSVRAMTQREDLVGMLEQYNVRTLTVVDASGRLLGVIQSDALAQAVQEETTADIQTMVGASKEERALSKPIFAVRQRLPWLQINLATAFLAASVVGLFEKTIAASTALAVLMPVVAGQSGNTGAQALAVTMRSLVLREIRVRHWLAVMWKEALTGFLNGVMVAATTSLAVYIWSRSPGLALVIGLSMVVSMVIAGLAGAAVPMALEAVGQDPAQSSSIILTTVTDVVGFFSFLGIATLLLDKL